MKCYWCRDQPEYLLLAACDCDGVKQRVLCHQCMALVEAGGYQCPACQYKCETAIILIPEGYTA